MFHSYVKNLLKCSNAGGLQTVHKLQLAPLSKWHSGILCLYIKALLLLLPWVSKI